MPDCAWTVPSDFSADRIRNTSAKQGFFGRWNLVECHDLPPHLSCRRIYLDRTFYFKGSGLRPRELFNTVKSGRQQYGDREHCGSISPTPVSRLNPVAEASAKQSQQTRQGRGHGKANRTFNCDKKQNGTENRHRQNSHGHTFAETPGLVVAMRQDGEQTETERQTNKQPPTVLRHNVCA